MPNLPENTSCNELSNELASAIAGQVLFLLIIFNITKRAEQKHKNATEMSYKTTNRPVTS